MLCELCLPETHYIVHENQHVRVILLDDSDFPGFCRVIWKDHVSEMTDLSVEQRGLLMRWVCTTEEILRREMKPDKINLASLGNVVPHLHWHVIPRFRNDSHFPNPIWGNRCHDTPEWNWDYLTLCNQLKQAFAHYRCD